MTASTVVNRFKHYGQWFIRPSYPQVLHYRGVLKTMIWMVVVVLVVLSAMGFYWSREPDLFDVRAQAIALSENNETKLEPGLATTIAVIQVAKTLLDKPGGYLTNDVTPPSYFLDNMPAWESGVLIELRDTVRALRDDFGRAQTQSVEDADLRLADARFHFDANHWVLPAAEDKYQEGIAALENYAVRLIDERPSDGQFYIRADNLIDYLATVEKRLGHYGQRLSGSVRQTLLTYDPLRDSAAREALISTGEIQDPTSWWDVDNVFYQARGYIWALLHTLKGVEIDFQDTLRSKNALGQLQRIIYKLEATQYPVWSPLIMNNTGFGMLTNHSLVMGSYISRANAAVIDLRLLLAEG